jgi:WD40 repeat protein
MREALSVRSQEPPMQPQDVGRSPLHELVLEISGSARAQESSRSGRDGLSCSVRLGQGRPEERRFPWSEELQADLQKLRRSAAEPGLLERIGARLREFLPAEARTRIESELQEALQQERRVILTIRSDAAELAALPWELLAPCEGAVGPGRQPGCLVRYEWPGTGTAARTPDPPPEGGRILYAWADPLGRDLPYREHLEAIRQACAEGGLAFEPRRDVLSKASGSRLRERLECRNGEPPVNVLHVLCAWAPQAGGAADAGLLWHAAGGSGGAEAVSGAQLAGLLQPHAGALRLVVLCVCDSGEACDPGLGLTAVAQALHRHPRSGIEAVIGSRFPLSRPGSVEMAGALYRKLVAEPASVEEAFLAARTAVAEAGEGLDRAAPQLHARAADGSDTRPISFRPYRGLLKFGPEHARFYFGRDEERRRLRERVEQAAERRAHRFQVVAGASGSGKSSLVLAGLIPDLAGRPDPAWRHSVFTPTKAPDAMLRQALGRLAVQLGLPEPRDTRDAMEALRRHRPQENLLLVVDQFEELFTQTDDPRVREGFVQNLWSLAEAEAYRMVVVAAMRIDFLQRCSQILLEPGQGRLDRVVFCAEHHTLVGQMDSRQLLEAITRPAQKLGLELEEGLAERLRDAAEAEPGSLPLLQAALDLLWQQRRGRCLSSDAVEGMAGTEKEGLDGVLRARADKLIQELQRKSPRYLTHARRLLVRLVELRDETARDLRRRVWLEEIRPKNAGAQGFFDRVVERLVEERLLVRGQETGHPRAELNGPWLELAHEALISRWDLLRSWIDEARAQQIEIRKLEELKSEWQSRLGDPDGGAAHLLRGGQLAAALDLRRHSYEELPQELERFIALSEQQEARERAEREEQERRRLEALEGARHEVERREEEVRGRETRVEAAQAAHRAEAAARQAAERDARRLRRGVLALSAALLAMLGVAAASSWVARQALRHEIEARDTLRMAAFRKFRDSDPTLALLFLREIGQPDRRSGWAQASLDILQRPVSEAILHGHRAGVFHASFSPDGRLVLTASADGTARVWRADGGGEPVVLEGPGGRIGSVAFSPDGTRVAMACGDGTARVWRAEGGGEPVVLEGHGGGVESVDFSLDGTHVATASRDGTARVWRAEGGGEPVVLEGHEGGVGSVAFSPDGTRVVTASGDGTARVWSAEGGGKPLVLREIPGGARSAAFSPDGTQVLIAAWQASAWVWKPGSPEAPVLLNEAAGSIVAAVFSPDGTRVATASEDGTARVWSADGRGEPLVLRGHEDAVVSVAFSPDGTRVVTASEDGTARVWSAEGGGEPLVLRGHGGAVVSVAFSPDGTRVATASGDGTARVWKAEDGEPIALRGHKGAIRGVAFSPDEMHVAAASEDKTARVWRTDGLDESIVLRGHEKAVNLARFSSNGMLVVTASEDGTARVWSMDGLGRPVVLQGHEAAVGLAEFSPDGRRVLTASSDGTARVWKADGSGERIVLKHRAAVYSAQFSPDGTRALTACSDGVARVWKLDGSSQPVELRHGAAVFSARFSPDGRRVLTACGDGAARVWNTDGSGRPVVLAGHGSRVTWAAFSPDGRSVATASWDGTVRVWEADGSAKPVVLEGQEGGFDSVAFSPDGARVAAVCRNGAVWVWKANGRGGAIVIQGDDRAVLPAAFSADGTRVPTASGSAVLLWPVSTGLLKDRLAGATSACIPSELRRTELGEPPEQALAGLERCRSAGPSGLR